MKVIRIVSEKAQGPKQELVKCPVCGEMVPTLDLNPDYMLFTKEVVKYDLGNNRVRYEVSKTEVFHGAACRKCMRTLFNEKVQPGLESFRKDKAEMDAYIAAAKKAAAERREGLERLAKSGKSVKSNSKAKAKNNAAAKAQAERDRLNALLDKQASGKL